MEESTTDELSKRTPSSGTGTQNSTPTTLDEKVAVKYARDDLVEMADVIDSPIKNECKLEDLFNSDDEDVSDDDEVFFAKQKNDFS